MSDEAKKLPKASKQVHSAYKIEPARSAPDAPETTLGRFFRRVNQIFNPTQQADIKLSGRIHELQSTADQVLLDLTTFKTFVEENGDPRLFSLLCGILDPITKEIARLQKVIDRQVGATQQVKMYTRYVECIEKGRRWIDLVQGRKDKESIQKAIIQQTIEEFHSRIDRDIQIIQDYLNHALANLTASDDVKNELKQKLAPALSLTLLKLYQLKEHPNDLSLDSLVSWRYSADHARENFFSSSLHAIDSYFTEFLPLPVKDHESEVSLKLLMLLVELEEKIDKIVSDLDDNEEIAEPQRLTLLAAIDRLENEAHDLNANLRLSHEHGERLQKSLEILTSLREQLSF